MADVFEDAGRELGPEVLAAAIHIRYPYGATRESFAEACRIVEGVRERVTGEESIRSGD